MNDIEIQNNSAENRFETTVNGALCFAAYELEPGRITFTHTEVPEPASGRGVAGRLAETALEHARSKRLRVVPLCSFIATYIERHGEKYGDLVDKS
jgi:uncharacterized protein